MLSDTERQALLDLEQSLTSDDPYLARFFHELDRLLGEPGPGRVGRAATTTTLVVWLPFCSPGCPMPRWRSPLLQACCGSCASSPMRTRPEVSRRVPVGIGPETD